MGKPKIVVINENTLAIQDKAQEITLLRAMATTPITSRFFNYSGVDRYSLYKSDELRLANAQDFDFYRVSMKGFDNPDEYEFAN